MNILEQIIAKTQIRTAGLKSRANGIKNKALELKRGNFPFEKVLKSTDMSFICEIKKASPSKGVIAREFPYLQIAEDYAEAGACAISVLTEPDFFLGSTKYLEDISKTVKIPLLRKDFIIDELQLYESKLTGANAVLLICSVLDFQTLKSFIKTADTLGLSCLVEARSEEEIKKALSAKARIIGVNNRDLRTFDIDISRGISLRKYVPPEVLFVSESGIKTANQIKELQEHNVNAVLIGESLMRAENKKEMLITLKGGPL